MNRCGKAKLVAFMMLLQLTSNVGVCDHSSGPDSRLAVTLMREYCRACHAVGDRRFLISDDNDEVWRFIFHAPAPSGEIWSRSIVKVLDWPTKEPPDPSKPMSPELDWMPKGMKRLEIVQQMVGPLDAREFILEAVEKGRLNSWFEP